MRSGTLFAVKIKFLGGIPMNIIFNQSDIEQMAASFKNRLSEAVKHIPCGEAILEDIQRWAREQNIDIPELLEATLKKKRDWGYIQC